ncbi:MAG TPA: hypothetical protein VEL74_08945 [Thermoanaerobaculia bacterium]|nr:hypothetical protein [Thermoanaerobaculia bacterium]
MAAKAKTSYSIALVERYQLAKSLEANTSQIPHLESSRFRLQRMLEELRELMTEQDRLQARKQEVTRRIQDLEEQSGKLAAFLKVGIKEHYGTRSERLVEFGLQPFRGRRRETPEAPLSDPEAPGRNTP